jgi:hypothetical protein
MNKSILLHTLAAVVLLFAAGSCNKDDGSGPGFDMVYREKVVIYAGISPFETHHFYFGNIQSRFQQLLQQHGKTEEDIDQILLEQGSITGVFGDERLEFLQEISIRLYDGIDVTDYIETAYRLPVPLDAGNNVGLIPTLADSKRFLQNNRFGIDVVLRLRNIPQEYNEVWLDLKFKATYK